MSRGAQPAGFCATSKQTRQAPAAEATVGRSSSWILGARVVAKTNVMGFFIRQGERVREIIGTTWR